MQRHDLNQNNAFIISQIGKPMMSCIFIGVMAFEMALTTKAWSQADDVQAIGQKAALIIPKNVPDHARSNEAAQPENFESYQIRILRNQNHVQSEKIKALREELLEVTQKLHELKPHLFRQGDPADKEKIAELTHQLGVKEDTLNHLHSSKRDMEFELSALHKKAKELETVKEALAAMVEKHRLAKDQTTDNFTKQIEEINDSIARERHAWSSKIQQHEAIQERLNKALLEKGQTVHRLNSLTDQQQADLAAKREEICSLEAKTMNLYDEILSMSSAFQTQLSASDEKINSLVASLEFERTQNEKLQQFHDQMQWLADLFDTSQDMMKAEIQKLKDELSEERATTAEFEMVKSNLEQHRMELALLTATHSGYKDEMEDYIQHLAAAVEMEQTRAQELEKQFSIAMGHQEAGHRYAEALEGIITQMDELLTTKEQQLSALQNTHEETLSNLLTQLDQSDTALEFHRGQQENLQKLLENAQAAHEEAEQAWQERLSAMTTDYDSKQEEWQERLAALTAEHNSKQEELQQQIQEALASHGNLEGMLKETTSTSQALEQELAARQRALAEREAQLKLLEESHAATHDRISQTIETLTADLDAQMEHTMRAEMALQDAVLHGTRLEQELANHKDLVNDRDAQLTALHEAHAYSKTDLHGQIAQLKAALEEEKNQGERSKEELSSIIARHAAQIEEQNDRLEARHREIHELQEAQSLSQDELTARLAQLSRELNLELARSADLQNQLENLNPRFEEERLQRAHHEQKANQLAEALDFEQKRLAELQGQLEYLNPKFEEEKLQRAHYEQNANQLTQTLDSEKKRSAELQELFENVSSKHDQEQLLRAQHEQHAKQLAQELDRELSRLNELHDLFESLSVKFDKEQQLRAQHEQRARELALELEDKMKLLAAIEGQTAGLDQDKQALVEQNNSLRHLAHEMEKKYLEERDHSQLQKTLADQLRNDLLQTEEALGRIGILEQALAESNAQLIEKESQIAAHKDHLYAIQSEHNENYNKLKQQHDAEKARNADLLKDLNYARLNYTQERSSLLNLEQIVKEASSKIASLQEQLNDSRYALEDKDLQIQTLNEAKYVQKMGHVENVQKLSQEAEQERTARMELQEALDKAMAMQRDTVDRAQSLEQRVHEMQEELNKQHEIGLSLNEERTRAQTIHDQMQSVLTDYETLQGRTQQLENQLREARELADQLTETRDQLTAQNQRLLDEKYQLEQRYLEHIKGQMDQQQPQLQNTAEGAGKSRVQRVRAARSGG